MCFSEAPINVITESLARQKNKSIRYAPFGVIVDKSWLFERGGRPVIYQSEKEFEDLPEPLRYRHVRYEPNNGVDHTWEREWRIRTEKLEFNTQDVTYVVPTRGWVEKFKEKHKSQQTMDVLMFEDVLLSKMPWHFLALEDLGVNFDDAYGEDL